MDAELSACWPVLGAHVSLLISVRPLEIKHLIILFAEC